MSVTVRIARIEPCDCLDHVRVILCATEPGAARHGMSIRVDSATGQGILAELSGIPAAGAAYIDIVKAALSAFEARVTAVECYPATDPCSASLRIEARGMSGKLHPVPVGPALLIAARLGVPLVVPPPEPGIPGPHASAADSLPEAFREFIARLDFGSA